MRESYLSSSPLPSLFSRRAPVPIYEKDHDDGEDDHSTASDSAAADTSSGSQSAPLLFASGSPPRLDGSSSSYIPSSHQSSHASRYLRDLRPATYAARRLWIIGSLLAGILVLSYTGLAQNETSGSLSDRFTQLLHYDEMSSTLESEWLWAANVDFVYTVS